MEAQGGEESGGGSSGCSSSGGGGGGGGEVRRVHIIYFLSRKGRIEHPHLIRVHHLSPNGVRLRDVKRWLSQLRGKDMPQSFSWSYKRKYKTGYVWQDLVDEDLITPISDDEYVLKGSQLPSTNFDLLRSPSHGEKKVSPDQNDDKDHKSFRKEEIQEHSETIMDVLTKTCSEIEEEESLPFSSETSTLMDDSMKLEEEQYSETNEQETQEEQSVKFESSSPSSSYSTLLNKKKKKKKKNINNVPVKSYYSSGASNMFRSFMKCGAADTNESAMVTINRCDKSSSCVTPTTTTTNNTNKLKLDQNAAAKICKGDKLGGSERIFGTSHQHPHPKARKSCDGVKSSNKNKSEFNNQKPISAA